MSIFDNIKITVKLRGFVDNPIAIATLDLNGEGQVRYIPIFWKNNRSKIFVTMPSLQAHGYEKCFVILDKETYRKITDQIQKEFLAKAEKEYHESEFEQIKKAINQQNEDINPDEVPL